MDPNETVNEVVSNWGVAMAMAKAKGDDKYFEPPKPASSDTPAPAESAESKESKESREKKGAAAPPAATPPAAPAAPKAPVKFRPRDDNETVNEVVSNWGAAQAMLQKKEGGAAPGLEGFRAADDNETVNEVVSNWGAAQAMLQKREAEQKPKPATPPPQKKPPPPPAPPAAPPRT
ncbi:hypothetical protein COOONC_02391 [Cooperia oncophora]